MTLLIAITGTAFSLFWIPVVRHDMPLAVLQQGAHPEFRMARVSGWGWLTPVDIWEYFRATQTVGWGWLGGIYNTAPVFGRLELPPGLLLVLLPVAKVAGVLHLSESFPLPLQRPTAWLILGPYEMLLSGVALFGLDALAVRLGLNSRRRHLLTLAEGVAIWQVVVLRGDPEYAIAIGLACYAMRAALDGRRTSSGWLLGAALSMQLFVVLLIPVILAIGMTTPSSPQAFRQLPVLARAAAVPTALVATPLIVEPRATWRSLAIQPTYPRAMHPTPWLALAPRLGHQAVSGGPTRLLAIAAACIIGYAVYRHRRRHRHAGNETAWIIPCACALSLFCWCLFEAVMGSYYVWPATAFGLLAAALLGYRRLAACLGAGIFSAVFASHRAGPWLWWTPVIAGLALACVCGIPTTPVRNSALGAPPPDQGTT